MATKAQIIPWIPWHCFECGNVDETGDDRKFHTSWHEAGDADVICNRCGSDHTGEYEAKMSNQRWEAEDLGGDRIRVERLDDGELIVSCLMEDTWERSEVTLDAGQAMSLAQFILGSGWNGVDLGVDNGSKFYVFTSDRGDPEDPDKELVLVDGYGDCLRFFDVAFGSTSAQVKAVSEGPNVLLKADQIHALIEFLNRRLARQEG